MSDVDFSIEEFHLLVQPLVGLPVSLPWKGYGSSIFLALGTLLPLDISRRRLHQKGEACIAVEWDWRMESGAKVLFGSSNSRPQMDSGIAALQGATVQSLSVFGAVPELVVQFSNSDSLRTMVMTSGDPEWSVKLPDRRWIYARAGRINIGSGTTSLKEEEKAAFASAERTALRWGIPAAQPKGGACRDCTSFVRVDGDSHLLDYGVCIADAGPFDGRAVNLDSGCPSFCGRE
jgi:hypothetical protein